MLLCYPAGEKWQPFVSVLHHRATLTTSTHRSPGTCCAPPRAAPIGTASASSPPSTTAPCLRVSFPNVYINTRAPTLISGPSLPNMAAPRRSVRFSPQGSLSLPRCDGRDEESGVHRAQSPRSYQQLPVCRLPDMSPAHPHQVTSCFLDLHDGWMD